MAWGSYGVTAEDLLQVRLHTDLSAQTDLHLGQVAVLQGEENKITIRDAVSAVTPASAQGALRSQRRGASLA